MEMKPTDVMTIAGDAAIDHAIARLVLAFYTDPVLCWAYDDPHQFLRYLPPLFRALAAGAFEAGTTDRTRDGSGVAIWFPPGLHGDDEAVEAIAAESVAKEKLGELGALLKGVEEYRPAEPHWYLLLIGVDASRRSKGIGTALIEHGIRRCDRERRPAYLWSSNPRNHSFYERHGFELIGTVQVGSSPPVFPMLRRAR
jgi:GNAT superfamily N-acetyltransferase